MTRWTTVSGEIIQGHGVASGQNGDPRFPGGTVQLQMPAFESRRLSLKHYFPGTINVSIAPHQYRVKQAKHTFRQVKWADNAPPEDFSFFDCRLVLTNNQQSKQPVSGLIYYPHPETKPEHFQDPATLEILAPFIDGLHYGTTLELELDPNQIGIVEHLPNV